MIMQCLKDLGLPGGKVLVNTNYIVRNHISDIQYTITALGRGEYPKLSTPLGLFPPRALSRGK